MGLFSYTSDDIAKIFRDRTLLTMSKIRSAFQAVVSAFEDLDDLALVALSVEAEAADTIAVQIEVTNLVGNRMERTQRLQCELFDSDMVSSLAAAYTMAETGSGSEVSTTGQPQLLIDTHSTGLATLTITDVVGASDTTIYLRVTPVSTSDMLPGMPTMVAVTFDAA